MAGEEAILTSKYPFLSLSSIQPIFKDYYHFMQETSYIPQSPFSSGLHRKWGELTIKEAVRK